MKLTAEQIAQIETTLVLNDLEFDDVKIELTDHIASEIEALMTQNKLEYQQAFHEAFENWKEELRPLQGEFWVSSRVFAPKLIMDKWVKRSKTMVFQICSVSILLVLLLSLLIEFNNNETILTSISNVFNSVYWIILGLLVIARILIWQSKTATTFGFMMQRNFILALLLMLQQFIPGIEFSHFNHFTFIDVVRLFTIIFPLVYAVLTIQILLKHQAFINQLNVEK